MCSRRHGASSIADNAISATAFKAMTAPRKPGEREENETEKGLRVQDKGFLNTAVIRSGITYIDGDAGGTCSDFLDRPKSYSPLPAHSAPLQVCTILTHSCSNIDWDGRGYPIEQLALKSSHLETAYLLIYGNLPTREQFKFFESEVMRHSTMHSDTEGFFRSFR